MNKVIVRYKLKPEMVSQNEALVKAVYKELHEVKPDGFRYATYKLQDGVSFLHIAFNNREDGINPLTNIAAFQNFLKDIKERCEEPPVSNSAEEVGSYEM
jgi:hypothetical protein